MNRTMIQSSYPDRRWIRVVAILIACHLWLNTASAQQGLSVAPLFEGKIVPQERMVETRIKGRMLEKYQLTYFRSVRFEAQKDEARRVHDLIEKDRSQQAGSQQGQRLRVGERSSGMNWHSVKSHAKETLMLQLPRQNNLNRYLAYKRRGESITVVYMEGRLESLERLKELIKE